jgi:PEP-CTERM motif
MIDRTLAAIAVNRATYFGMGGAALALAAALLSAGPSRADVITMTVKGFTGGGYLAGGTLVAQFTGTPETDGTYQQSDLTNATATYTVGAIKYREYSLPELIEFSYTSPTDFNYDFDSNSNGNYFAEGDAFVQDTTYYQALVDYNGASSSSPYTVNVVPGSSVSTASAPVPEPSTWVLFGLGAAGIAIAGGKRKSGRTVLQKWKAAGAPAAG